MRKKAIYIISGIFLVFALVLVGRLGWLQLVAHGEMLELADKQQVKTVEVTTADRGGVVDRNGASITNEQETPAVLVFPSLVGDISETSAGLGEALDLDEDILAAKIGGVNSKGESLRYQPFYPKTSLSSGEVKAVEALGLQGVFVNNYKSRYLRDTPLLHTLGSLGTVTQEDILQGDLADEYEIGDIVGVSGLERIYENILKGTGGSRFGVVVDEKNQAIDKERYYSFSGSGETTKAKVELTVDLGIQRCVEEALAEVSGAAVVLDSSSGDVLALASTPEFDPYYIEIPEADDAYVNKGLRGYPPASLFKILVTGVALEEGIISEDTPVVCNGSYTLANGREIHCWKEEGHGLMTFSQALAESCNPVYVDLVLKVGSEALQKAFVKWELDEDILLGYPLGEISSLAKATGESSLANEVLGEEGVLLTPVNIAKMINVIASGGKVTTPRLVTAVYDEEGGLSQTFPQAIANRVISQGTGEKVKDMMVKTFTEGTGASLDLAGLSIAGKTGSSETANVWIGGFLPAEEPQYTVVILVENGSSGVGDAGPVLKKIAGYLNTLEN